MEVQTFIDQDALQAFQAYVFSLAESECHKTFSENLMERQSSGENAAATLQDQVTASDEFKALVEHPGWVTMAARGMKISEEHVKIVFPHFRVDLPDIFEKDKTKMLLPWHQERDYWIPKGDCSNESIVLSTYLHDAGPNDGALVLSSVQETVPMEHSARFMDEENRRFYRVECPEPESVIYGESRFGDTIMFDFLRRHRSGFNGSKLVRLTFLLRASDKRLI